MRLVTILFTVNSIAYCQYVHSFKVVDCSDPNAMRICLPNYVPREICRKIICVCQYGYYRDDNDMCVRPVMDCSKQHYASIEDRLPLSAGLGSPSCGENEQFDRCRIVEDSFGQKKCKTGCFCRHGFYRDHISNCVQPPQSLCIEEPKSTDYQLGPTQDEYQNEEEEKENGKVDDTDSSDEDKETDDDIIGLRKAKDAIQLKIKNLRKQLKKKKKRGKTSGKVEDGNWNEEKKIIRKYNIISKCLYTGGKWQWTINKCECYFPFENDGHHFCKDAKQINLSRFPAHEDAGEKK